MQVGIRKSYLINQLGVWSEIVRSAYISIEVHFPLEHTGHGSGMCMSDWRGCGHLIHPMDWELS